MEAREPKVFAVIGGRGSGKTYYLEHKLYEHNTVVFELVKTNRWVGYTKYFYEDYEAGKISMKDIANKKIVFEDATSYVSSNMKNSLKKLIVYSKQLGSDVFIVFHSINIIPPFMWNMLNYIIMFRCPMPRQNVQNADYYKDLVRNWQRLEKAKPYTSAVIETNI